MPWAETCCDGLRLALTSPLPRLATLQVRRTYVRHASTPSPHSQHVYVGVAVVPDLADRMEDKAPDRTHRFRDGWDYAPHATAMHETSDELVSASLCHSQAHVRG